MQLFGKNCGCESRKHIMFESGNITPVQFLLILGCILAVPTIIKAVNR